MTGQGLDPRYVLSRGFEQLQEQELAQTRVIKHTLDQALGPSSEADFGSREITASWG
jgi:hypothetical protein